MYGALVGFILGLLTRIKNQPHGQPDAETCRQQDAQPKPCSVVVTYAAPSLTDEEIAEKKERQRRDIFKFKREKWGLIVLAVYTFFTGFMWWETKQSADAAKTAADIAELSERPWIKIVEVTTHGNNLALPALSFQGYGYGFFPNGNKQATLQLKVSLKNIGHSVAQVYTDYELFLPIWDKPGEASGTYAETVATEQKKFCALSSKRTPFPMKFIVFPNEPSEWNGGVSQPITPQRVNQVPGQQWELGYVLPVAIVCINYRLGDSSKVYQTSAVYEVFDPRDRTRFFAVGKDVIADRLLLERNPTKDEAY